LNYVESELQNDPGGVVGSFS
ncbi:unnamed protein product, partial [Rotaria sp. Silwood1]